MRVRTGRLSRSLRHLSLPALCGAAITLFLAACQSEPTGSGTDTGSGSEIRSFGPAPGAVVAARAASVKAIHHLPIVPLRKFSASVARSPRPDIVNSPFDLTYFGGALVNGATSYNIYINCDAGPASCWGTGDLTPGTFLGDLNRSDFIRVANEYIGSDARGHFPVTELSTSATFVDNTATIFDLFGVLFSAVSFTHAVGYTAVYHLFLPQGTDMCIDDGFCYSPDDFSTFAFCAFHASVDFGPNAHVLFSVEPYQAVPGCTIPGQAPHGVIDATASTLSHELIEAITDPDGDAWFNAMFGLEIADICSAFGTNQRMGRHAYVIQSEYSNRVHACTAPDSRGTAWAATP